jgi:DNA polymerase III delta prime subunit
MKNTQTVLQDLHALEKELSEAIRILSDIEDREMESEPEHRKMLNELINADFITNLPNQAMRDSALEDYVMNNEQYREKHREYLTIKNMSKRAYRDYRFIEECLKDRRAELQSMSFGGEIK